MWDDPEGTGEAPGILLPAPRSHPEVRFNEAQVMRVLFLRPHPTTSQGEEPGVERKASVGVWEGSNCRFLFCVQGRNVVKCVSFLAR